jgi:hypothetical protein
MIILFILGIIAFIYHTIKENTIHAIKNTDTSKKPSRIKTIFCNFWSYKEMRSMVGACIAIYFASLMLPSKIEIAVTHDVNDNIKINHDFSGNMYNPINFQLSDRGYPVKVEVTNK